ncbi:hypothetical protein [Caloranaerobacter sp. DY30410]|uniref:hypothetical protein n=1 Tax=Caloranaerobacter sp. DY30410 TaxID=3238305 RepID=UPI003D01BD36
MSLIKIGFIILLFSISIYILIKYKRQKNKINFNKFITTIIRLLFIIFMVKITASYIILAYFSASIALKNIYKLTTFFNNPEMVSNLIIYVQQYFNNNDLISMIFLHGLNIIASMIYILISKLLTNKHYSNIINSFIYLIIALSSHNVLFFSLLSIKSNLFIFKFLIITTILILCGLIANAFYQIHKAIKRI